MTSPAASPQVFSLNGVPVADSFAEAFPITGARVILTAASRRWARIAAQVMCGYGTSVIGCNAEAALEWMLSPQETPDGRPGASVLAFSFGKEALAKALIGRVGQCVLTCPTTACFNGLLEPPKEQQIGIGSNLRFYGDTFQTSKKLGPRRFWRIPVMDGEFVCEDRFGTVKGVGGGNMLICATTQEAGLEAAGRAVRAMRRCPDVILPFPGGIVRSGSKVGGRYKKLKASTSDAWCPTIGPLVDPQYPPGTSTAYEIVIDGLTYASVQEAMRAGLHAASKSSGLTLLTAGNYGGKLGPHHFHLRDLL